MSVEVEIYMSKIIKFFKENPNELTSLVPLDKEDEFYKKIRKICIENLDKGEDVALTQKQIISICLELNNKKNVSVVNSSKLFFKTKYGVICMN